MYKYQYMGKIEVAIKGVGIVQPDQAIETDKPINHPLFRLVVPRRRK